MSIAEDRTFSFSSPAAASVTVVGGQDLADELAGLERKLARGIIRDALKEGSGPMLAAIRSRINSRTGMLSSSVRVRAGKGDRPGRTSVIISAWATAGAFARHREMAGRSAVAAKVRESYKGRMRSRYDVYYGYFVEMGHRTPGGKDVPAHSFARAGFDATVDRAGERIEQTISDGIGAV